MIEVYNINDSSISLKSDLAAEFPVYIFLSENKDYLLYSISIKELFRDERVIKPLKLSDEGLSFLLQIGVVPPPQTIYKNIFILGIGDCAEIYTSNETVKIKFSHTFPFLNEIRHTEEHIDENYFLELISNATISKLDTSKKSLLFHSAGKDSNTIALALAEAGYQDKITCISHKSDNSRDESEISAKIAQKLGFKHHKLYEPNEITNSDIVNIHEYFKCSLFPSTDVVALAYPLYLTQYDFNNSNIIDGMGNDVYIGHIPSSYEYTMQQKFSHYNAFRPFVKNLSSRNKLHKLTNTKLEWMGSFGFSYGESLEIFPKTKNISSFFANKINENKEMDYFELRASFRGVIMDQEIFMRKVKNFAELTNSNMIFPWTDEKVAKYFSSLPEKYLFDREKLKNKLALRNLLKDKLDLDSDKLGKMGYSFNFTKIIKNMKYEVVEQILSCDIWNKNEVEKLIKKLFNDVERNGKKAKVSASYIQRLYLISGWINFNAYLKVKSEK